MPETLSNLRNKETPNYFLPAPWHTPSLEGNDDLGDSFRYATEGTDEKMISIENLKLRLCSNEQTPGISAMRSAR
jgi:hypothetical protein